MIHNRALQIGENCAFCNRSKHSIEWKWVWTEIGGGRVHFEKKKGNGGAEKYDWFDKAFRLYIHCCTGVTR